MRDHSKEIVVSIDVETDGPIPGRNSMLNLGAVAFRQSADGLQGEEIDAFAVNLETLPEASANEKTMAWWRQQDPAVWEKDHLAALDNAALKKGLKTVWFSTGNEDALFPTSKATVALLQKHGFDAKFTESTGAHTWINWRNYLNEFAPLLFR